MGQTFGEIKIRILIIFELWMTLKCCPVPIPRDISELVGCLHDGFKCTITVVCIFSNISVEQRFKLLWNTVHWINYLHLKPWFRCICFSHYSWLVIEKNIHFGTDFKGHILLQQECGQNGERSWDIPERVLRVDAGIFQISLSCVLTGFNILVLKGLN